MPGSVDRPEGRARPPGPGRQEPKGRWGRTSREAGRGGAERRRLRLRLRACPFRRFSLGFVAVQSMAGQSINHGPAGVAATACRAVPCETASEPADVTTQPRLVGACSARPAGSERAASLGFSDRRRPALAVKRVRKRKERHAWHCAVLKQNTKKKRKCSCPACHTLRPFEIKTVHDARSFCACGHMHAPADQYLFSFLINKYFLILIALAACRAVTESLGSI